ncbi:MAG: type II toxin-antitoxin system HicA family toxin [Nitrososphaerales archaeon]
MRQKSSHVTLTNDICFITVPLHAELDRGTLIAILNDARIVLHSPPRFLQATCNQSKKVIILLAQ